MRAILQPSPLTTPSLLTLSTSVPLPTPLSDEVLVRVRAYAPCKGELLWARDFPSVIPASRQPVPGQDVAGVIASTPPGESAFRRGDGVFARIEAGRPGAARDYATARLSELARIPRSLQGDWTSAAAVPLSSLTAWQALFWQGGGAVDERAVLEVDSAARAKNARASVLVTGASGAVGAWVVQLAAAAGVGNIVGVAGGKDKVEAVKALGATEVLDYRDETRTVKAWISGGEDRQVDLVVDCAGALADAWTAVKDGGRIVSISGPPDMARTEEVAKAKPGATGIFFIVQPLGSNLEQIAGLLEAGKVKPVVDAVYEFAEFKEAFERVEGGRGMGKVVVKVSEDGDE